MRENLTLIANMATIVVGAFIALVGLVIANQIAPIKSSVDVLVVTTRTLAERLEKHEGLGAHAETAARLASTETAVGAIKVDIADIKQDIRDSGKTLDDIEHLIREGRE